jgi:hypothetical protein
VLRVALVAATRKGFSMRHLRHALAAAPLLFWACAPFALVAPAFAQTCACAPAGAPSGGYLIQADEPPPPLPEYSQPPIPAPGYYWTPGYWAWNNYDYYWVPGVWVEPPQPGLLWTPGYWAFVGGVYAFNSGYWGPHVGFYGGINYGYGYNGLGYQGGRWDSGRFFYNTTVNNIGAAHITNVYTQNVVNNTTINSTSFNGGAGGVAAKPTAEEMVAGKEAKVRPTALQINQARAASMKGEQFVSTNRGKPAIAATARPGEFKGKGALPARAAGKAAEATAPPAGSALPETMEKPPIGAKPTESGTPPTAPRVGERPPAAEKPITPEAAPNAAKKEEKPPAAAERTPAAEKAPLERPPTAARPPAAVERTPERAPAAAERQPAARPPAAEKPPRPPEPNAAAQRMIEKRPTPAVAPKPAQPEHRPPSECGRPGLPPCPK